MSENRRHARPRWYHRRPVVTAVALLVPLAQLAALAHYIVIPHTFCLEHQQIEHAHGAECQDHHHHHHHHHDHHDHHDHDHSHGHDSPAAPTGLSAADGASETHSHDRCPVLTGTTDVEQLRAEGPSPGTSLATRRVPPRPTNVVPTDRNLTLLRAPKTSPPVSL